MEAVTRKPAAGKAPRATAKAAKAGKASRNITWSAVVVSATAPPDRTAFGAQLLELRGDQPPRSLRILYAEVNPERPYDEDSEGEVGPSRDSPLPIIPNTVSRAVVRGVYAAVRMASRLVRGMGPADLPARLRVYVRAERAKLNLESLVRREPDFARLIAKARAELGRHGVEVEFSTAGDAPAHANLGRYIDENIYGGPRRGSNVFIEA